MQIGVNISGASATGTIMGPTASLSTASGPVSENGGVAVVTATLPAPISVDTVLTRSFGGDLGPNVNSTVSGANYNAATQALTIPAGSTSASIILTGKLDGHYGPPQDTTTIAIAAATGSAFTPAAVIVTFNEADPPPSVTLSDNGGQDTITATLSQVSGVATTVPFTFAGTAVLGTNYSVVGVSYNPATMSLVIPVGQISASNVITGISQNE